MSNKENKDLIPIMVQAALSQNIEGEDESKNGPRNCSFCNSKDSVERKEDNEYFNPELNFKMTMPAYVCSHCEAVVYEPESYRQILEAEETAQGRPYIKVEVKNGKISKYSMH